MLLSLPLDFHAPEYLREEVFRHVHPHAPLITESGAGFFQAQRVLNRLLSVIHLHPPLDYIEFDSLALSIAPHEEDAAYLALAITLGCPLWSNDHALAKQNEVRVLTTQDVLTFIGK